MVKRSPRRSRWPPARPLLLAVASAALLLLAFPGWNQSWAAWIALVPWLILVRRVTPRAGFWWSYLIGLLFFLGSLRWLTYVTVLGWIALCAFLALYFATFGWIACHGARTPPPRRHARWLGALRLLTLPAAWVALEYARSAWLSGFGWNLLAYSQAPWVWMIQLADVTGAWGVSFLLVLVNVAAAGLIVRGGSGADRRRAVRVAGLCVAGAVAYGLWRLPMAGRDEVVRIAVVQGNVPQEQKWDATFKEEIKMRYASLTKTAMVADPDLIVWPEAAVPGSFGLDVDLAEWTSALARYARRPLLVGVPVSHVGSAAWFMTNSSALIDASGGITDRYDKLRLVPFGEFVPFERTFPWLRRALPPIGQFTPGRAYTVFRLRSVDRTDAAHGSRVQAQGGVGRLQAGASTRELPFSTLICFEDLFPALARRFVREGARLLIVMTNDAWFGPTAAAYQHAQASIFRAVESRVPVARAANTGWSGCIDAAGRVIGSVRDATGRELFVEGTHTCDLTLGPTDSVYLRWGDWFAWLCVLWVIGSAPIFFRSNRLR